MSTGVVRTPLLARDGSVRAWTQYDVEDASLVARLKWHINTSGYAAHTVALGKGRPARTYLLHRLILGLERGDPRKSDHINGDRLDNRRSNLRIVTSAQNAQNRKPQGGKSQYRGVSWYEQQQEWGARGCLDGRTYYLGFYKTEEEAAEVASVWRKAFMPYAVEDRRAA